MCKTKLCGCGLAAEKRQKNPPVNARGFYVTIPDFMMFLKSVSALLALVFFSQFCSGRIMLIDTVSTT
ncbi:hypothetical protein GMMP15_250008 [Candidatus Magnetomoraceae bacterium gMMP-15]